MGTWGAKLYQDDLALDIKEDYIEKLKSGKTNEEALNEILEMYEESIEDEEEGPIFWLVLADTMWKVGRLTKEVKEKAIQEIERGTNLKYWEEEGTKGEYRTRERELQKLKEKLNSPMPEERKLAVKREIETKRKFEWNIGDVYAYRLKSEEAKKAGMYGQYLILRKVDVPDLPTKRISAIVHCQICDGKLPETKEELEELEYVVLSNQANVRYNYRLEIPVITQKSIKEDMIYIGHFENLKEPPKEYIELSKVNNRSCFYKELEEYIIDRIEICGTSKKPKEWDCNLEIIMDSQIRFLAREKYYEEELEIEPEKDTYITEEPLLYIALVDSMMIGGWVKNPVGELTDEMKEKAYADIAILRKRIIDRGDKDKERKIRILDELQEKIKNFKYKDIFAEFLEKTKNIGEDNDNKLT